MQNSIVESTRNLSIFMFVTKELKFGMIDFIDISSSSY